MPAGENKATIRGGARERALGALAGWLIRIYSWSLRITVEERSGVDFGAGSHEGLILAVWHNRIFAFGPALSRRFRNWKAAVLTSASKDGAILAGAAGVFRAEAARGSTSRRSKSAMMALLRKLRQGYAVVITPDGPRGPRYGLQAGVVKLAQISGAMVVPVRVEYSSAWQLKSWDRFRIPRPFSAVTVVLEPALDVPRELDEDEFEGCRERIEEILRKEIDDLPQEHDQD